MEENNFDRFLYVFAIIASAVIILFIVVVLFFHVISCTSLG